jgi:AcrR family transcriptional regulator
LAFLKKKSILTKKEVGIIMGISERREREKFERRNAILECAKELILQNGVEKLSMEDIAQKAELSKATIYLYFSGKEALLHEICEDSARIFLEHFKPIAESGLTGIRALQSFWQGYLELFGSSHDMLIVFEIRNFLNPGNPFVLLESEDNSKQVSAVLEALKGIIDQCKAEGVFDAGLDSVMATQMVLSMFSSTMYKANRIPAESRKSPLIVGEITNALRIVLQGFAQEGVDRSQLNIGSA